MQPVATSEPSGQATHQKGASLIETLEFTREPGLWDRVRFVAISRWPILESRLRYRTQSGVWSLVSAMEIFLLICTGHNRYEIARWLNASRDTVNNLTRKLTKAGVPIRRASRPECYTASSYHDGSPGREGIEARRVKEIESRLIRLVDLHQRFRSPNIKRYLRSRIDGELSRLHLHRDMKYELRTPAQRYRPMTELALDGLMQAMRERERGKRVGHRPVSDHGNEFVSLKRSAAGGASPGMFKQADGLLVRYWTGNWPYTKAYQFGIFTRPGDQERFEASLRTRCLIRRKKNGLSRCKACAEWLEKRYCRLKP